VYDAIVIGARCAGATTALLLARAGLDVLVVDRAEFPSEIPHGHFIHQHGPRRLAELGLLEAVLATNCPAVTTATLDFGDGPIVGRDLASDDGVPLGVAPRRGRFDALLVDAAVEAGAEFRDRFAVQALIEEDGRVAGVVGRDARGGVAAREPARLVVGADGRNSWLARTVGAPASEAVPTLSCWYFSYWSGVPSSGLELHVRDERAIFAFPTNDGLMGVFVAWPTAELARVRGDIEAEFGAVIDGAPELAERLRAGRREERFLGATQLPNFLRTPYGPGWALVGDAGCHKDPFRALGICDALRDAELLAGAVADGLGGRRPLEAALAGYEARRNEATLPGYRENLQAAQLRPPPEQRGLIAAMRGDQDAVNHFFRASQGMVAPETFFNPENLRRLMAGAR
jgi:flavin-dependent dehydrogenase